MAAASESITPQVVSRSRPQWRRRQYMGLLFVLPAITFVIIFFIIPLIMTLWMSLHNWPLIGKSRFIGLDNYATLLSDKQFWASLGFTTKYTLLVTPAIFIPAFGLALLVNQKLKGVGFFRTVYFMPVVIGLTAVCLLWNWLAHDQVGVFNSVLRGVGLLEGPKIWMAEYDSALIMIIIMVVWKTTGFSMVLLLVGIQAIPDELYEAAKVDGASYWGQLRYITMPLLRRTFALALVLSIIGSYLAFEPFRIMTNGRPQNSTISVVYWIYNNAFTYFKMGYAAALSVVLMVILILLSIVQLYLLRGETDY
ncbi:MAG: sugar ABC transporter permease [Anaerolineae bacterium]|nr:sugar ABC transporter permease [Anaerolineae bacterium]